MDDPTNWNVDAEVGSFAFANAEEAKKAEAIMNKALRDSFENGKLVGAKEALAAATEALPTVAEIRFDSDCIVNGVTIKAGTVCTIPMAPGAKVPGLFAPSPPRTP